MLLSFWVIPGGRASSGMMSVPGSGVRLGRLHWRAVERVGTGELATCGEYWRNVETAASS